MKNYVIFSTIDKKEIAKEIGKELVESKLVACVNIVSNVESIYRWKGETVFDNEYLLIIKVSDNCLKKAIERIKALHPYEVPEIIAVKIDEGNSEYLNWIVKGCGGKE